MGTNSLKISFKKENFVLWVGYNLYGGYGHVTFIYSTVGRPEEVAVENIVGSLPDSTLIRIGLQEANFRDSRHPDAHIHLVTFPELGDNILKLKKQLTLLNRLEWKPHITLTQGYPPQWTGEEPMEILADLDLQWYSGTHHKPSPLVWDWITKEANKR